ncbi:hypothetical protein FRC10_004198 [Ceratobasidium sp. 414]|nr:hypothetical protein FRC10_004198 [Ceratobasidium sp. 414]
MSARQLVAVKVEEQKPELEQDTKEPARKRARGEVDQDEVEEGRELPIASTSTSNPSPDDKPWPFIAVRYAGRAVAINRRFHYIEVIASIKKVFLPLRAASDEQIRLVAVFQGLGDNPIEISAEVWPELAADIQTITVVVSEGLAPSGPQPVNPNPQPLSALNYRRFHAT